MADLVGDVAIVGGGLAGLRCAQRLNEAGVQAFVLEAKDRIGGRVQTDSVDGFLLDRGFQVLLTAYPEASRTLDFSQLDLQSFLPGALVRVGGRFHTIADPWRRPNRAFQTLRANIGSLSDKLRIGTLSRRVQSGSLEELFARPEQSTVDYLRQYGFSKQIIDRFFRPFLGGVFLEPELRTSSRMFEFVFRMFAEGGASLPASGMGAIPDQMAATLTAEQVKLNAEVVQLENEGIRLKSGELIRAEAVVLATEGTELGAWVSELPEVQSRSVTCLYFTAEESPLDEPILVLNGEGNGLVNNLCVPSDISSRYAPPGASLISATVLGNPEFDESALTDAVRAELKVWFGEQVERWRHLKTYRIAHALPELGSHGLAELSRPVRLKEGLFVCGDHRDTPSIEGALVSGRRAAEAVLQELREKGRTRDG
ncbi:MAG: NAD(P)/FAD-dependent oxidoreductase [Thermoguttaceae bacterium]